MPKTLAISVLFSASMCVLSANSFEIGRVTDVKGAWQDARTKPPGAVHVGTKIFSDSRLRRASNRSKDDQISIKSFFTPREELFACSQAAVCNDRDDDERYVEVLNRVVPPAHPFGNFLKNLKPTPTISQSFQYQTGDRMAYYAYGGEKPSAGITKDAIRAKTGPPSGAPVDAPAYKVPQILTGVVPVTNGRGDLTDVVKNLPDGDYKAKFCSIDSGKLVCDPAFRSFQHRGTEPVYWEGFTPGSNMMTFGKTIEEAQNAPAFIVAVGALPENQAKIQELYAEALTVVGQWSPSSKPLETAILYLYSLSANPQ